MRNVSPLVIVVVDDVEVDVVIDVVIDVVVDVVVDVPPVVVLADTVELPPDFPTDTYGVAICCVIHPFNPPSGPATLVYLIQSIPLKVVPIGCLPSGVPVSMKHGMSFTWILPPL